MWISETEIARVTVGDVDLRTEIARVTVGDADLQTEIARATVGDGGLQKGDREGDGRRSLAALSLRIGVPAERVIPGTSARLSRLNPHGQCRQPDSQQYPRSRRNFPVNTMKGPS